MADLLKADIAQMNSMKNKLDDCADKMKSALDRLEEVGPRRLGTDSLDDACDDFQDSWRHGLDLIRDITSKLSDGLKACIDMYSKCDEGHAQVMEKMGAGL